MANISIMVMMLISIVPPFFFIIDGYFQKNIKKGVYYTVGYCGVIAVTFNLVIHFGYLLALSFPVILFLYLLFSNKKTS
jgi:hypothetical protein